MRQNVFYLMNIGRLTGIRDVRFRKGKLIKIPNILVWVTKINVKKPRSSRKVCENMGNSGKHRKIKGNGGLIQTKRYFFDNNNENAKNCIDNLKKNACKKGENR